MAMSFSIIARSRSEKPPISIGRAHGGWQQQQRSLAAAVLVAGLDVGHWALFTEYQGPKQLPIIFLGSSCEEFFEQADSKSRNIKGARHICGDGVLYSLVGGTTIAPGLAVDAAPHGSVACNPILAQIRLHEPN